MTVIITFVYLISSFLVCYQYANKAMDINLISLFFLFCPGVNTLYVIILIVLGKYTGLNNISNSFRELFK